MGIYKISIWQLKPKHKRVKISLSLLPPPVKMPALRGYEMITHDVLINVGQDAL